MKHDPVRMEMAKQDLNEAAAAILNGLERHYGDDFPCVEVVSALGYLAVRLIVTYEERTGIDMMTNFMKTVEISYNRVKGRR